jgi:protocatechuate 3,4-dioxygenase beta subunit
MLMAMHPAYELSTLDISAAAGQSATKEIALTPLARVSGVVLNDEKKPVVAAAISAQNAGDGGMGFMNMRAMMMPNAGTVSGPDGRFSFRVRTDDDLKLRAVKKGFPPATSEAVKLAPGERRGNFVLTIPSGIEVTGKVTDQNGNPLSGVSVMSSPTPNGQRGMVMRMVVGAMPGNDEDTVKTASDGTYSIRVTEGSQDFAFKREGFSTKNVRGKTVSLAGPNVVDATLDPSVEISGRVVRGGAGVEGVNLMSFVFGGGDSADAVTGPDGSFTLRGLSPGSTRVMIRKEEDLVNEQRQLTAPGRDVVIELPAGIRVSGRVVEKSTKKPVTSFQVGVSTSRSGGGMVMMMPPMLRSVTSDDGSFTLDNVPLGAINFVASAPGYTTTRMNLNVEEGKPITNLEVELDTGVRLFGKITAPDGTALADATVSLAMMGGPGMNVARATDQRTVTNSSGEYELDALEPGEETIEVSHSKYLPERKTVELKGHEQRLDVQLSAGNRVSGVVVTESGAPVADADVSAFASGGFPSSEKTDASGRFEFDSLSPARYQFSASKAGYVETTMKDVDVAAGTPVRLVLKSGGTIYGSVRGLTAEELTTTTVEARGAESNATATVDANGAYRLEGVPAGTVSVRAVMMGRGFSSRKVSPSQVIEMAPGASRQLDLEYRSDTVIQGRVRRNGQPLSGASVMFFPKPGSTQQTSASTTTDEQGNYSVSGLENGEYTVMVNDMQRFTSHSTTYEVRGSATFDIDHNAYTLRGRVVNAATGDPLNEARVQLRGSSNSVMRFADRVVMTDMNGTFSLDLVSPGSYLITADKQSFGNEARDITITDRPMDDLELRLQPGEGATLKVVDPRDGRALRAQVVVFDMQGRVMNNGRAFMFGDDNASDTIPLAAGQYQATVSAFGYGTRQVSLSSPSTQTIALTPAARLAIHSKHSEQLTVRLVDSNGWLYPRWSAIPPSAQLLPSPATTTIDNLGAGTYTLQLIGQGGAVLDSKQVMVAEGQTVEVDL